VLVPRGAAGLAASTPAGLVAQSALVACELAAGAVAYGLLLGRMERWVVGRP
jgi:hypothetical protein